MPLTEQERVQVKHHTGFLNVNEIQTFALGVPAGVETQYIIEGAMNRVNEAALPLVRKFLGYCETIECQKVGDLELMAIGQLDTIQINQSEQGQLDRQYDYWVNALCNALGIARNPFDARKLNGPGINVRVG